MPAKIVLSAAAFVVLASAPSLAQTDAQTGMKTAPSQNLSAKLSQSGGVIKPKSDIDPGMKVPAPAPHPNTTPVIPPSATGGNTAK